MAFVFTVLYLTALFHWDHLKFKQSRVFKEDKTGTGSCQNSRSAVTTKLTWSFLMSAHNEKESFRPMWLMVGLATATLFAVLFTFSKVVSDHGLQTKTTTLLFSTKFHHASKMTWVYYPPKDHRLECSEFEKSYQRARKKTTSYGWVKSTYLTLSWK